MAEMLAPPDDFTTPNVNRVAAKSKPKSKGRPRSWIGWGVVALALLLLIGLPVASWYAGLLDGLIADQGDFTRGGEYTSPHFNYRFKLPARDWKQDPATGELTPKVKLKAPVTLRRTDPNSWLALSLVKNDKRTPQEAELIDEGVSRLRAYFKDLEFEQTTERLGKPIVLGGRPAVRVVFRAEAGDVMMVGECLMVAHQGIAYWLTTWAPEMFADQVFDEWERLREGFAILKDRDGWQEKKPKQIPLLGMNASYAMSYSEGLWERRKAIDYDSLADAALHGRDETEPTHADKTATALVLVLPAAEDLKSAAAAARVHLEMRQKAEYKDSTFEDVAEKKAKLPDGPPDEVGDAPGRILKLHVKNGESRERFVYLGVVPLAEQVLVIQCDCDWRRRTYWEVNFVNLIRTLRVKK